MDLFDINFLNRFSKSDFMVTNILMRTVTHSLPFV